MRELINLNHNVNLWGDVVHKYLLAYPQSITAIDERKFIVYNNIRAYQVNCKFQIES